MATAIAVSTPSAGLFYISGERNYGTRYLVHRYDDLVLLCIQCRQVLGCRISHDHSGLPCSHGASGFCTQHRLVPLQTS